MANEIEVKVPDIGSSAPVDVIEILVQVGDHISVDTPLITLESDKASMEIPSPLVGIITQISVKVGDKITQGNVILSVAAENADNAINETDKTITKQEFPVAEVSTAKKAPAQEFAGLKEIKIPDIGGSAQVDVIEIMVHVGDYLSVDTPLITLESDKASMEIPSPLAGTVTEVRLKVGDKVSEGTIILLINADAAAEDEVTKPIEKEPALQAISIVNTTNTNTTNSPIAHLDSSSAPSSSQVIAAGPAVRRLARELGVNLVEVTGSGRKTRITKEDVQAYVKKRLSTSTVSGSLGVPLSPVIDFTQFGDIEAKPLNKIKKLTGINVHRSWITIPHVTQFDSADITDLEAFRKSEAERIKDQSFKLTLLAFVCAVVSKALRTFPQFNASLDANGADLIYKKYCNIGIAVETPNGLVVPVIKQADKLNVVEIATEMSRLSLKARDKGLMPADMSGGCFTISSLGGIGGTAFTPIVNSPEVAILGLSRAEIKPIYEQGTFQPKLMLPLSLSYDHRVIDGAEAARFTRFICDCLSDIRRILL